MKSIPKQLDWPPIPTKSPIICILIGVTIPVLGGRAGDQRNSLRFQVRGFGMLYGILLSVGRYVRY